MARLRSSLSKSLFKASYKTFEPVTSLPGVVDLRLFLWPRLGTRV